MDPPQESARDGRMADPRLEVAHDQDDSRRWRLYFLRKLKYALMTHLGTFWTETVAKWECTF